MNDAFKNIDVSIATATLSPGFASAWFKTVIFDSLLLSKGLHKLCD